MTVATINVVIYILYILFYMKGKLIRLWIHRKSFLEATSLS